MIINIVAILVFLHDSILYFLYVVYLISRNQLNIRVGIGTIGLTYLCFDKLFYYFKFSNQKIIIPKNITTYYTLQLYLLELNKKKQ